nr:immunoglobulin light chain junction region [Macaca mulatta]MOY08493.1 immunoglobulin light chain junction region [Macaca mulatta]MOY14660.1 immunoglobulin light chain junction region [Macaca mulatta]MOY14667.1 immunoglobulin light chain junction region [Macaca mulatta]MOY14680.1 immunoglobulin light chain junction region [Macaca mulatta]
DYYCCSYKSGTIYVLF